MSPPAVIASTVSGSLVAVTDTEPGAANGNPVRLITPPMFSVKVRERPPKAPDVKVGCSTVRLAVLMLTAVAV